MRVLQRALTKSSACRLLGASRAPGQHRSIYGFVIGENAQGSVGGTSVGRPPMDFSKARIGQCIDTPYELTVDPGWVSQWHSCFFQHDRLYTSDPFAQKIGLNRKILPFSMMLFQTVSMSHVDEIMEVMELGYENGLYLKPAYAGDTFKKQFFVKAIRPSNSGNGTVVTLKCELSDQTGEVVFSCDKIMWYPYSVSKAQYTSSSSSMGRNLEEVIQDQTRMDPSKKLVRHIVDNLAKFSASSSLASIKAGQLILHTYNRPLGLHNSMGLNVLFRQGHPLLFNTARYSVDEIVMPGPLTFALTTAASSRALFEIMYEELMSCRLLEKVNPATPLGALSYVASIRDLHGFEEITLVTLGVQGLDVHLDLKDVDIPISIFTDQLRMVELRKIIKDECPVMEGKLVLHSVRKLVRQAPFNQIRDMPLL